MSFDKAFEMLVSSLDMLVNELEGSLLLGKGANEEIIEHNKELEKENEKLKNIIEILTSDLMIFTEENTKLHNTIESVELTLKGKYALEIADLKDQLREAKEAAHYWKEDSEMMWDEDRLLRLANIELKDNLESIKHNIRRLNKVTSGYHLEDSEGCIGCALGNDVREKTNEKE